MGGPIDEDPPQLITQYPDNQSINITPKEIILEFDEYIKLENPNKNIIITPRLKKEEIITTALKTRVTVELNQDLEPNTTYVFNFQKSVQDLSEGNPAENLKVVFSTGETIDSLTISGSTNFLFPSRNTEYEDILIGLYEAADTTDLFTAPPYYIAQADSTGAFTIENIRAGNYLAYAWLDANNSLKAEFKSEEFSFITDTIKIQPDHQEQLHFNLSKANQTGFKLSRSAPTGTAYQLVFNKGVKQFDINAPDSAPPIFHKIEDDRIKLYAPSPEADSLALRIKALDSINQTIDTLVWAKFEESDRKEDKLSVTIQSGKSFYQELNMRLDFSKPISAINFDSLYLSYDSASSLPIDLQMLTWRDSSSLDQLTIQMNVPDSITASIVTLKASDSTFLDITGVFNEDPITGNFKKLNRESLADEIFGTILTDADRLIVQLLTPKEEIITEQTLNSNTNFSFTLIEPGSYKLRVIEDTNQNGQWDPADFSLKRHAEKVYYFIDPETNEQNVMIRGGWSIGPLQISSIPDSGIKR